jgi:hypothetical protein
MKILNLTQHPATEGQVAEGVSEPANKQEIQKLLTFTEVPSAQKLQENAARLAEIAKEQGAESAMVGGAPFFMSTLEKALLEAGVEPLYGFSLRTIVEETASNGEVKKTSVFVHAGWVRVE